MFHNEQPIKLNLQVFTVFLIRNMCRFLVFIKMCVQENIERFVIVCGPFLMQIYCIIYQMKGLLFNTFILN